MFLGLIIVPCDLRHIYHSEWPPPHYANRPGDRLNTAAAVVVPESLPCNQAAPPCPPTARPPSRVLPSSRASRASRAPPAPPARAAIAPQLSLWRQWWCHRGVPWGEPNVPGRALSRLVTPLWAEAPLPCPGCGQRCLCRDPVVGRGAFAYKGWRRSGKRGRGGSGHCIAAASTKRWNGAMRIRWPSRISIQPKSCRMTGLPRGRTGPGARPGNARPGCATLWGRRG